MEAATGSQMLEGDKYPTSPLVVPTVFRLIAYSATSEDVYMRSRDEDEFNDDTLNPVMLPHSELNPKVAPHSCHAHSAAHTKARTHVLDI